MSIKYILKLIFSGLLGLFLLNSCNGKLPGGDARKFPDDPALRVKKNLEEGRGFKYSGGVIISDWYSTDQSSNESIKVSIRFLTNEIRSDALDINVFNRKCDVSMLNCKITKNNGVLITELKKKILKKAAFYKKEGEDKKKKKN